MATVKLQKETKRSREVKDEVGAAERRRYNDACAAAHAMDLFGERWSMPIMRELMMGPRRFTDIKNSLSGISAKMLTERLESLEGAGILFRRKLPPPASVQVYELTPWGYEARPIFQVMGKWAVRSPRHDTSKPFSPVSLMLSLRTMFSPAAAGHAAGRLQLRMGEETFHWTLSAGIAEIGRGSLPDPDTIVAGTPMDISAVIYGGLPIEQAIAEGRLAVEGDLDLLRRMPAWFPMPEPAPERMS